MAVFLPKVKALQEAHKDAVKVKYLIWYRKIDECMHEQTKWQLEKLIPHYIYVVPCEKEKIFKSREKSFYISVPCEKEKIFKSREKSVYFFRKQSQNYTCT